MSRNPFPWMIGAMTLLSCAPGAKEPEPAAPRRAQALSAGTTGGARERTFHSAIPKTDLLAATRARLPQPVDEAVFAAAADKVNAYTYVPSNQPETATDPGQPAGTSFAADAKAAIARVALLQGGQVEVACMFRPCVVKGDFDGDGIPDLAVQIARKQDGVRGVGMLTSGSQPQVLAAGNAGPLGTDTLWAESWSVESVSGPKGQYQALKASGASPAGAILKLTGPDAAGVAYLERAPGGGAVQLKAAVTSGAVQ